MPIHWIKPAEVALCHSSGDGHCSAVLLVAVNSGRAPSPTNGTSSGGAQSIATVTRDDTDRPVVENIVRIDREASRIYATRGLE